MSKAKSLDFLFNQLRNGAEGSLAGGTITFYSAGTTTPLAVFLDRDMTLPSVGGILTPYPLTADGTASLFGLGLYDVMIKDFTGAIVYFYEDVELTSPANDNYAVGPLFISIDANLGNVNETWTAGTTDIIANRVDNSGTYTATLTLPIGYTMADSAEGTYSLTTQGETVNLHLNGSRYYVV